MNINNMELQSIRHMLGEELLGATKAQAYSQQCQDPQLKNLLQDCVRKHQSRAQKLMQAIQG